MTLLKDTKIEVLKPPDQLRLSWYASATRKNEQLRNILRLIQSRI